MATIHSASFRDPSGFIFHHQGILYRQVNPPYQPAYDHLLGSGLYEKLAQDGLLVRHREVEDIPSPTGNVYRILQPEVIPFISYPYEWSFSQYKDAALVTLEVAAEALKKGMILKDASAFNIQFVNGKPLLIDTLSFDIYQPGKPWDGYRQFCQHFLAPLALAAHTDIRFLKWMAQAVDGMPLDLASALLPARTRLALGGLGSHIHIHARLQGMQPSKTAQVQQTPEIGKAILENLFRQLKATVQKLTWKPENTEWADYYEITNYSDDSFKRKETLVTELLEQAAPQTVWDMGANNGHFSRLAARMGAQTLSSDIDYAAVEKNYRQVRATGETNLLPLVLDLTNPSPAIGWANKEREDILARGSSDLVMALALIHHICISNNVPFRNFFAFLARAGAWAIVEFVPKEDSQVQKLLATRKDIFGDYHEEGMENAARHFFTIVRKERVADTARTMYLLKRGGDG